MSINLAFQAQQLKTIVQLVASVDKTDLECPESIFTTIQFLCLSGNFLEYGDTEGKQTFSLIDECVLEKKGCEHFVYICKTDLCNIDCENIAFDLTSSTSTTTTKTSQKSSSTVPPPSTTTIKATTEIENNANLQAISFHLFGLLSLTFSIIF
uniref:Uncharacterized protein n=1 Tax=Panagrolaimus sp. ES5 TaxID=591445 RepID=A0AC34GQL5_9BILA